MSARGPGASGEYRSYGPREWNEEHRKGIDAVGDAGDGKLRAGGRDQRRQCAEAEEGGAHSCSASGLLRLRDAFDDAQIPLDGVAENL